MVYQSEFPIFVISLPGDEKRRQPLVSALDELGLAHEISFGVDGRNGLPSQFEDQIDRRLARIRNGRAFTDAEFACALSHQAIYAEIGKRGLPGALVLEDDAVVDERFGEFIRAGAYRKADMILLGHQRTFTRGTSFKEILPGVKGYQIASPPVRADAYSLGRKTAATIRRRSLPLSKNADWPCDISRFDCLALSPKLVDWADRQSSIQKERLEAIRNAKPDRSAFFRRLFILDDWYRLIGRRRGVPLDGKDWKQTGGPKQE